MFDMKNVLILHEKFWFIWYNRLSDCFIVNSLGMWFFGVCREALFYDQIFFRSEYNLPISDIDHQNGKSKKEKIILI